MVDVFTKEKRSWVMSRIRGKETGPERRVEKLLRKMKIKFRKHYKVAGSPDFVLLEKKIAIFVDGDFWHGYDYESKGNRLPEFWKEKIKMNIARDKNNNAKLKRLGWEVVRIWEHDLERNPANLIWRISEYVEAVQQNGHRRRREHGRALKRR